MFAYVIYDETTNEILIVNDSKEKKFIYVSIKNEIIFSNIISILKFNPEMIK